MTVRFEYSEAELNLFKEIAPTWVDVVGLIPPTTLYTNLAEDAFLRGKDGPSADALRRVCLALRDCRVRRGTKEFDDLCRF